MPSHFYDMRNNTLAKKFGHLGGGNNKVDILRLSHNVRRNMKKEDDDEYGTQNNLNK